VNFLDERLPERFWNKVKENPITGCWEWTGHVAPNGYGRFMSSRTVETPKVRCLYSHRVAYQALVGCLGAMHVDHLCRNRRCCRPDHCELVTKNENTRRGLAGINNALKTHCPRGHEFNDANVVFIKTKFRSGVGRRCRLCKSEQYAAYRSKKKASQP